MSPVGEVASSWVPPPLPNFYGNATVGPPRHALAATSPTSPTPPPPRASQPPTNPSTSPSAPRAHQPSPTSASTAPAPTSPPPPAPKVVATHAGVLLLRVPTRPADSVDCVDHRFWDHFVYIPAAHPPRLDRLPNPYPKRFNDSAIVSVSGDDDSGEVGYVVAALQSRIPRQDPNGGLGDFIKTEFDLHRYRSSRAGEGWTTTPLAVADPVRDALVPLPHAVADVKPYHYSGKTVTIGGERGTVAWVDLWRGVLLCDVLDEDRPVLRDIPLPFPARGNWDRLLRDGDPGYVRDVTVGRSKGRIKYVEMEIRPRMETRTRPDSYLEWVRGGKVVVREAGWKMTAWSLPIRPVGEWEDWRRECDVDVGDLTVVDSGGEPWGLSEPLAKLQGGDREGILRRLSVAYPTMSMEDDDNVYLLSVVDGLEVVVAVDVRKKMVRGVAGLDPQKRFDVMPSYCSSEMSSYLE